MKKSMAFRKTSKPGKGCDDRENLICNSNKEESINRSPINDSMCKTNTKKTLTHKYFWVRPFNVELSRHHSCLNNKEKVDHLKIRDFSWSHKRSEITK